MALTLKYDFATSPTLVADTGPTLTIARASTATVTDYDNVLRTVQAAEARFSQGRRVENLCIYSEDFSNAEWVENTGATKTTGQSDPVGGTDAVKIVTTSSFNSGLYLTESNWNTGETKTYSCWLKGESGGEDILFGDATNKTSLTLTTEWQRLYGTVAADSNYIIIYSDSAAQTFYAYGAQIENVSGQDDPSPSEYQATTTAAVSKWYATKRRTNLILQSNDLSTTWSNVDTTDTQSAGADPFGGSAANKLLETATTTDNFRIDQTSTITASAETTFSVYAKSGERDYIWLRIGTAGRGVFKLSDGTIATAPSTGTVAITDAGSGWYRCSMTLPSVAANAICRINISDDGTTGSYTGDAAKGVFIYGAQLEKGSTATAYIPTTTTVASSAVDTAITATGLLVEEARTNLALKSQEFDDAEWSVVNSAITANQTTAPDGTTTADLYEGNGGGSGTTQLISNAKTTSTATAYCISLFAKADNLSWLTLIWDNGGVANTRTYFDVGNGVVGTEGAGADSSGISDFGNGWYRCWISFTSDAVDTTGNLRIELADGNGDVTVTLDGTSSIFVWGAQLEAGAFPTSYIPTTTVSVTRAADDVTTTDVSWLNAAAGTMYCKSRAHGFDNAGYRIWALNDGTANEAIEKYNVLNRSSVSRIRDGGSTLASFTGAIQASDTSFEAVMAWALNDAAAFTNGAQDGVDDTAVTIPTVTIFDIGQRTSGATNFLNGHIAEIRYYNSRLDNAALLNMSNGIFPASGKPGLGLTLGKLGM